MKLTVCISDSGDDRLSRTLASLGRQIVPPDEVLIERRGTVAGSRNLMFKESTGDVVAFIDTDQEAPPWWSMAMSAWIWSGWADYVCGPTQPHPVSLGSRYSAYLAEIERRHYIVCRVDQTAFPMGNSMWSRHVLEAVAHDRGGKLFDERFTVGGEDYDVNLRATKLGFLGLYVPHAWVWHDQSSLNNPLKIMRRKLRYSYSGALAMLRNQGLSDRVARRVWMPRYVHWLEGFQKVAQVVGLGMAYARWRLDKA